MLPNIRPVVRLFLPVIVGVGAGLFSQSLSLAQDSGQATSAEATPVLTPDATAAAPPEAERVTVTGSYIPVLTAAEVGPNPVQVIDRDTIEKSGERNLEELLRSQPVANANGVPTSGQPGNISGQGASSISLRGFDPGATLVLINGHRMVNHPSGTNGGAEFFVDLNTIPKAAIESVEILKDGASTTYGADAVAGVVNIKFRHDYTGGEVFAEYGNSTDTDSGEASTSLLFGVGDKDTNITGVLNYYSRNSIFNRDRDYDRQTPISRRTTNSEPYNLELSRTAVIAAGGNPDPSLGDTFFGHAPFFSNGNAPASDYIYYPGPPSTAIHSDAAHFSINHFQGELPDTRRWGVFLTEDHKIFGDQMIAYADFFFQRNNVHNEQAPENTASFQLEGSVPITIPPHSSGPTLGGPSYADTGVPANAYNPFNPFQQIISGDSRGRLFEFGNRQFETDTDAFFTTVGLRGDKLFDGNWGYDAAFRYSRMQADSTIGNFVSTRRFNRILNAADPIFDPSSSEFIGTTIPFNPFGDYRRPIPNNYRFADFALTSPHEEDKGRLAVFDLNIYSTNLLDLPAGGIGFAFGGQYQDETLAQTISRSLAIGDLRPIQIVVGPPLDRQSYAGYAEISIPVFGRKISIPGFYALDFSAAARYESFSNGSNVMVPKVGARWQPLDESLTLRATWGEGYKIPSLIELSSPTGSFATSLFDPVKQTFVNDVPTTIIPNVNVQPEDSRNFTAGAVYSPQFAPGLTVSIDLFDIETTGWVNPGLDPTRELIRIERGGALPGESVVRDANGNLVSITTVAFHNSGTKKSRGADFSVAYELQSSVGTFRSTTQATYLDSFEFSPYPGVNEKELRSSPTDAFSDDAYLKWRAVSRLEWLWNGVSTALTVHYLDGFHEFLALGPQFPDFKKEHWVKQTWLFDYQLSYDFGHDRPQSGAPIFHAGWPTWKTLLDGAKLTLGVNNIFNHDPPKSNDNFPRFIYDPTGRFVYASITEKF